MPQFVLAGRGTVASEAHIVRLDVEVNALGQGGVEVAGSRAAPTRLTIGQMATHIVSPMIDSVEKLGRRPLRLHLQIDFLQQFRLLLITDESILQCSFCCADDRPADVVRARLLA